MVKERIITEAKDFVNVVKIAIYSMLPPEDQAKVKLDDFFIPGHGDIVGNLEVTFNVLKECGVYFSDEFITLIVTGTNENVWPSGTVNLSGAIIIDRVYNKMTDLEDAITDAFDHAMDAGEEGEL